MIYIYVMMYKRIGLDDRVSISVHTYIYIYIYVYAGIGTLPDTRMYHIDHSFALGALSGTIMYFVIRELDTPMY